MKRRALVLHETDNVGSALVDLATGVRVEIERSGAAPVEIVLKQDIPLGHKFALARITEGEAVIKHGLLIGEATQDIAPGMHVHTHNLA